MAKIYRVIKIKLDQLIKENVHMFTDLQQSVFKHYHSDRHLSEDKKFLVDNTNIHCKPTEIKDITTSHQSEVDRILAIDNIDNSSEFSRRILKDVFLKKLSFSVPMLKLETSTQGERELTTSTLRGKKSQLARILAGMTIVSFQWQ